MRERRPMTISTAKFLSRNRMKGGMYDGTHMTTTLICQSVTALSR